MKAGFLFSGHFSEVWGVEIPLYKLPKNASKHLDHDYLLLAKWHAILGLNIYEDFFSI